MCLYMYKYTLLSILFSQEDHEKNEENKKKGLDLLSLPHVNITTFSEREYKKVGRIV